MKKALAPILLVLLFIALNACDSSPGDNSGKSTPSTPAKTSQDKNIRESEDKTSTQPNPSTANVAPKSSAAKPPVPPAKKASPATSANQVEVTLVSTIDGDTIKVNENGKAETIRYLLIDTPEEKKPGTCVEPFAMDAAKRNEEILKSGKITLEFEEKNKIDKYGRTLAYVFVNGNSVQETLLKEGYARVAYIYYPPYKYLSKFQADDRTAKSQRLRIWSKPGYATPNGFMGCVGTTSPPAPKPTHSLTSMIHTVMFRTFQFNIPLPT